MKEVVIMLTEPFVWHDGNTGRDHTLEAGSLVVHEEIETYTIHNLYWVQYDLTSYTVLLPDIVIEKLGDL